MTKSYGYIQSDVEGATLYMTYPAIHVRHLPVVSIVAQWVRLVIVQVETPST